nr:zinc finger protein 595-like [Leptinotarsa decemlineata]XP_023024884.1 zinc finger protein 595-like [Leptinotarsa decemlineata]
MTTESQQICRLCLKEIESGLENIDDIQREMLEVLLIKVDWSISEHPVLCRQCFTEMQDSFTFKSNCIDIEDYLTPFKENVKLDLKTVYIRKKDVPNPTDAEEHLCRLCIEPIDKNEAFSNKTEIEKFKLNLPEIDLELTTNVVFCPKCYSSLQNYFAFSEKCLESEKKIHDYCKIIRRRGRRSIFLDKFLEYSKTDSVPIIREESNGKRKKRSKILEDYKCDICSYTTRSATYIQTHKKSHIDLQELFECTMCPLKTKYENVLNKHMNTIHSDHTYSCNKCSFQTKHKISLVRHVETHELTTVYECHSCHFKTKYIATFERHVCKTKKPRRNVVTLKNPSEIKMYKCDLCQYKSNRFGSVKKHKLVHKNPSEIKMYECDLCQFKSKRTFTMKKHKLVHEKPEQTIYKCLHCEYNTFSTWALKKHIETHGDVFNVNTLNKEKFISKLAKRSYKCTQCEFASLNNRGLKKHIAARHNGVVVYKKITPRKVGKTKHKCSICGYETHNGSYMKLHLRKHQQPSEVEMHKCNQCSFETKWAICFKQHQNIHKDPSEVRMYQCPMCTFKTIHRRSILRHKQVRHNFATKSYKCKKCNFQTKWSNSMRNHQVVHASLVYNCTKCSFQTRYPRSLRNHLRDRHNSEAESHNSEIVPQANRVQCAECMQSFKSKETLIRHFQHIHRKDTLPVYRCDECPYVTNYSTCIKVHKIMHTDSESLNLFECKFCIFKTKYKRCLKNHISSKHE